MGRRPVDPLLLGVPTFGTVLNTNDPTRSPAGTLRISENVKLQDGSLRAFKAPGYEDVSASASTQPCIAYVSGKGWVTASHGQQITICHDSVCPWASSSGRFSYRASYFANCFASDGNGQDRVIGTPPPTITGLALGIGGMRQVRITVVPKMTGLDRPTWGIAKSDLYRNPATGESNPNQSNGGFGSAPTTNNPWLEVLGWDGAVISIGALGAAPSSLPLYDGEMELRVYARPIGATSGPAKLIMRQAWVNPLAPTTVTISAANETTWGTDLILAWDVGGAPDNPIFKADHGQAPFLTVVSEEIHTVAATSGGTTALVPPSAGILVAAAPGGLLCWSALGYPWRWPVYARQRLDGEIWAIVTSQATTYIATTGSWWVLSGTDDYAMSLVRTEAEHAIVPGFGKSAWLTPRGVMYLTADGIALFDGSRSALVHRLDHPASPALWTNDRGDWGGYWNGYWMADIGAGAGVLVDTEAEGMPATFLYYNTGNYPTSGGQTIRRVHVSMVYDGVSNLRLPALWANVGTATGVPSSKPKRWDPRDDDSGLNSATEWMPWQAMTQRIRPGTPFLRNRFRRYEQRAQADAASEVILLGYAGANDNPTAFFASAIPLKDGVAWMPATFDWVEWLQLQWQDLGNGAALKTKDERVYSVLVPVEQYAPR